MTILEYSYEFSWRLRLPTDELPSATSQPSENTLIWRRSNGNIILGFFRQRKLYPVGAKVVIVTNKNDAIGIAKIVKSETHILPDGSVTTVIEFIVIRLFEEQEKQCLTKIIVEMDDDGIRT